MTKDQNWKNIVEKNRAEAKEQLAKAEKELVTAKNVLEKVFKKGTQADRELAETKLTIAQDRVAEARTNLIELDIIETEFHVRTYERSTFEAGAKISRTIAQAIDEVSKKLQDLMKEKPAKAEDRKAQAEQIQSLKMPLQGLAENMRAQAEITEANAKKEAAMSPEAAPGGTIGPTRPRNGGGGDDGEGDEAGDGGGGGVTNINLNFVSAEAEAEADARAKAAAFADALARARAKIGQPRRRRRRPDVAIAVQVTNPTGDVEEGSSVNIEWTTSGGTAPRTATIEIFAPQTSLDHPADFHPIVEGTRDTGTYQWTVAVPRPHYSGMTISSPQNPVSLPGFYIRVTVTDVSGAMGSDTTPIFSIIRR